MKIKILTLCLVLVHSHVFGTGQEYSIGIEKQSDEMSSVFFNKHWNVSDGFGAVSVGLSLLMDEDINSYVYGVGVGYHFPISAYIEDLDLDIDLNHYLNNEDGIPVSQIKTGISKSFLATQSTELRLGIGGYYNLAGDEITGQRNANDTREDWGGYLSLSWRFLIHTPDVLPTPEEPSVADYVLQQGDIDENEQAPSVVLYLTRFDVNSSHFNSSERYFEGNDIGHIHFTAHYSCSGTNEYNKWLSLRRINRTQESMAAEGIRVGTVGYTVSPTCVAPEDIRVEVTRSVL